MVVVRFRNSEEHEELLKKVKRMKKFVSELEECLEDGMEDDYGFREHKGAWEEDEMNQRGRYSRYRMGSR